MRYARPVQLSALALRQVARVLEPEVAALLQFGVALLFGPANRVDGLVDELDDVEFVEGDLGVGQAFRGAGDEGRAHVDAHLVDGLGISPVGRQVLGEDADRAGILALGHEQDAATNEIDEQADIVVATPGCRLVKGDAGDVGVIGAIPSLLDVVVDDPPQSGVPLVNHPRDNGHRHRLHHGHDQRLEQQRKTAVRPRPGDRDPFDPAPLAGDPRHPRMQVGFVLKEVQVPPGLVLAVVGRTAGNAALRAGEPAAPCLRRGRLVWGF